jgi:hypothetical protein
MPYANTFTLHNYVEEGHASLLALAITRHHNFKTHKSHYIHRGSMNAKAFAQLREIADAIDTLQDHMVIGDAQADSMFIDHLNDIDISLEDYWDHFGEKCPVHYKFLGTTND